MTNVGCVPTNACNPPQEGINSGSYPTFKPTKRNNCLQRECNPCNPNTTNTASIELSSLYAITLQTGQRPTGECLGLSDSQRHHGLAFTLKHHIIDDNAAILAIQTRSTQLASSFQAYTQSQYRRDKGRLVNALGFPTLSVTMV